MASEFTHTDKIFVFGSNYAGRHGAGAALTARREYGATYGKGEGRSKQSYAIPTKDWCLRTLPPSKIRVHVDKFIEYARARPTLEFFVSRIGCGLAGYNDAQIAPMFECAPSNCELPHGWRS